MKFIINNEDFSSSNPYDYIKINKAKYEELMNHENETFKFVIKDLIEAEEKTSLKIYLEAIICSEINTTYNQKFDSGLSYLNGCKSYPNNKDNENDFSEYDKYAKSLLK